MVTDREPSLVLNVLAALCIALIAGWLGILFFVVSEGLARNASPPLTYTQVIPVTVAAEPPPGARTTMASSLHIGPGVNYAILGTIPEGALIEPLEFSSSGDWLAIRHPPNSTGRAWLPRGSAMLPLPAQDLYLAGPLVAETLAAVEAPQAEGVRALDESELRLVGMVAGAGLPLFAVTSVVVGLIGRRQSRGVFEAYSSELVLNENEVSVMGVETVMDEVNATVVEPSNNESAEGQATESISAGIAAFEQAIREAAAAQSSAFASLTARITEALARADQGQRSLLTEQQAALAEAKEAAAQARTEAERASSIAIQIETRNHEQAELFAAAGRERDEFNRLINDLRGRIAALASLAAPFPSAPSQEPQVTSAAPAEVASL